MIQSKIFEIRDSMTYIPVLATRLASTDAAERYHLARTGFYSAGPLEPHFPYIALLRLNDGNCQHEPFCWPGGARTMRVAHEHIQKHWDSLNTGDVIDVEFISGETSSPKKSERLQ